MTQSPGSDLFAPSEQVYLRGELFASKAGIVNSIKLMHLDQKVSVIELVQNILASAFLSLEKAGAIRLETRSKKALFGLSQTAALYAEPVRQVSFPEGSLENSVYELAVALKQRKETNEVRNIVFAWAGQDSNTPWQDAISRVQRGLAARGLLDVIQEKKLKVFTVSRYELPEQTARLASEIAVGPLKQVLDDCCTLRPDLWKQLNQQIKKAIDSRYKSSDD